MNANSGRPAGPVVLPAGHGLVVPPEWCAELAAALELLAEYTAGRRPPASVRQPRPTRAVLVLRDAAKAAAVEHQAARHQLAASLAPAADQAAWDSPTASVVALPQTARTLPQQEITTEQARDLAGLSTERWRQLAAGGAIPARRFAGRWLLDRSAVVAYAQERQSA